MRYFSLMLVLAVGAALAAEKKPDTKPAAVDGTWKVVSIDVGGQEASEDDLKQAAPVVTIMGGKWKMKVRDTVITGTIKVDAAKKPMEIVVHHDNGQYADATMKGILEIKDDTMKACCDIGGTDRPTEFSTKDKPTRMLITYQREKK